MDRPAKKAAKGDWIAYADHLEGELAKVAADTDTDQKIADLEERNRQLRRQLRGLEL